MLILPAPDAATCFVVVVAVVILSGPLFIYVLAPDNRRLQL